MSSELRSLHVVVISRDVSLLHEISWMLEAVEYNVETASDIGPDALWRRYAIADFLIVDGRTIAEPTAEVFSYDSDNPTYRLFVYDPSKRTDFSGWYAAGAHDALRTPLSRGELLARARTGARYLEFERRLQFQSSRCTVPGMYSRRGLLRKLRKLASVDDFVSSQHALIVTSIDWYSGICAKCGETASRNLINTAARTIKRVVGEDAAAAYLGDGRFATLLGGQSPVAAKCIAESLAKDFVSRESNHDSTPRPTLTSAVVPWSGSGQADKFLNEALESIQLAEQSGGDRVVLDGEFNKVYAAWKEEMSAGNPFENVVAQDIMEPFPAILSRDGEPNGVAEALRHSEVPLRPYVDSDGRLVGVAGDASAEVEARIGQSGGPGGEPLTTPETIPHDATFPEIYEAFSSRGCATLVVTGDDQPLGYLTCDGFLSLITPIHSDSFAHTNKSADDLAYLVVPSMIGEGTALEAANA